MAPPYRTFEECVADGKPPLEVCQLEYGLFPSGASSMGSTSERPQILVLPALQHFVDRLRERRPQDLTILLLVVIGLVLFFRKLIH